MPRFEVQRAAFIKRSGTSFEPLKLEEDPHRVEFAYRNNPWWMGHGMKESTREQGTGFYRLLITSRRFPRTALAPLLQTSPLTLENLGGRGLAIRTTYFHVKISFQNFPRSYFTLILKTYQCENYFQMEGFVDCDERSLMAVVRLTVYSVIGQFVVG